MLLMYSTGASAILCAPTRHSNQSGPRMTADSGSGMALKRGDRRRTGGSSSKSMSCREFARDQDLLHLVGAIVNLKDPRVTVEFLHRVVVDEAVAAVDLNRRRADALAHLGGEQLGHRGLLDAAYLLLLQLGGVTAHLPRHFDLR